MVSWILLLAIPEQPHHVGRSRSRGFAGFPNVLQMALGKQCEKPPLGCLGVRDTKSINRTEKIQTGDPY